MGGGGEVVAAHVGRERDIGFRVGADQIGGHAEIPEFEAAEGFDDLRAGAGGVAAIEQTGRGAMAGFIGIIAPPDDAVAAGLVENGGAAGNGETEVHGELAGRDVGIRAVPDDSARFILIEAEMDIAAQEVAGLRVAFGDGQFDLLRHGIRGSVVVLVVVAQEGVEVAGGGVADAEDERVFGGVDELIQRAGSKPPFAQMREGSGVPGKGVVLQSAKAQSAVAIGWPVRYPKPGC